MPAHSISYGAAAAVTAVLVAAGCSRTPPHRPTADKQSETAVRVSTGETRSTAGAPAATDKPDVRAVIRDPAVQRASFAAPIPVERSEQQLAADALSRIGPPAVPMLVQALRSPDHGTRLQACTVLARMGPDAKEAVPELVQLLEDEDEDLRRLAATALGRIGPDAADAVPALMRQMLEAETPSSVEPARLPPQ